jgi:uncharacterized secreted repeat protein (TIGR03808 family)
MKFARRSMLSGLTMVAAGASAPAFAANQFKDLQTSIQKAIKTDGVLKLGPGTYGASGLRIAGTVRLEGVPGRTAIAAPDDFPILQIENAAQVTVSGITFDGGNHQPTENQRSNALVVARDVEGLEIENCNFINSGAGGLRLESCSGRVSGNHFSSNADMALFALDSKGLEISSNTIEDSGNNGIQVWRAVPGEDGTLVVNNRIARVTAISGGTGQNGNGINVFRAGNVTVEGNRISDCAFSAIRNNSGSNCQIAGNSISRTGEVAIYCEFGFEGAVITGNIVEDVAFGISITNFNQGGRLAVCANNLVRDVRGGGPTDRTATGIAAEADAQITGNVVENAFDNGISLGWGEYCRNLSATGNTVRNCGYGLAFSASPGARPVMITGNRIAGSTKGAIQGMVHKQPVGEDQGAANGPALNGALIAGNLVS